MGNELSLMVMKSIQSKHWTHIGNDADDDNDDDASFFFPCFSSNKLKSFFVAAILMFGSMICWMIAMNRRYNDMKVDTALRRLIFSWQTMMLFYFSLAICNMPSIKCESICYIRRMRRVSLPRQKTTMEFR